MHARKCHRLPRMAEMPKWQEHFSALAFDNWLRQCLRLLSIILHYPLALLMVSPVLKYRFRTLLKFTLAPSQKANSACHNCHLLCIRVRRSCGTGDVLCKKPNNLKTALFQVVFLVSVHSIGALCSTKVHTLLKARS